MRWTNSSLFCLLLMVVGCALLGCGDSVVDSKLRAQNANNIRKMGNAYKLYAFVNGHRGPSSADELKSFLKTNKAIEKNLKRIDLDLGKLDSYFVSEVDGEPLEFRWGVKINPELEIAPIVFDKTGVDGMRRVLLACDVILEVTDEKKYGAFLAGNIKKSDVPAYVFGTGPGVEIDESTEAGVTQ